MRILHLVPGSGGSFYCQNCLRDLALIRALRRAGHDVMMTPLYLPVFDTEVPPNARAPIFFGGINVYLREVFPMFRNLPRGVDRLLDSRWMLERAAAREGMTRASELGPMTISMLQGRGGNQKKEFQRFLEWLAGQEKPDVVHLSNALLLGFAPAMREVIDAPFVCSLQDEEPWVDAMRPPYDGLTWDIMARHATLVSAFIATGSWYASRMQRRMNLSPDRVRVVYPGIASIERESPGPVFDPPKIGFLSRVSEAQGFGDLMEAFVTLKQDPAFAALRLTATGGILHTDQPFVRVIEDRLRASGLNEFVEIRRDFKTAPAPAFFDGLSVMSTPVRGGEAFGMHLIEALARGVPVVQPNAGAYPEIIEATGGGVLYDPAKPDALANALKGLLEDRETARRLGRRGREAVQERFTIERAARETIAVYESVAGGAMR